MSIIFPTIISIIYLSAVLFIFLFSMAQLTLVLSYWKKHRQTQNLSNQISDDELPTVTVQLPLYNELYVSERLIDSVASLDYPSSKLEIQVLDDSNDESVDIVAEKVNEWKDKGINIKHIRREDRSGFKAGALAYGMEHSKGEFLAIFDADFLPPADFLKRTVPHFNDPEIGMVQTRWGHINEDYSLLTKLQAFGLNGHFIVEQSGRNSAGSFINFNGTAGVWRRQCIDEAGGWSADTLTEDLDLSYRAQMKGWKFHYLSEVITPAELPVIMPAIKSQQYRWNKGGAETARKHLGQVIKHPDLSISTKFHALFHLASSSVFLGLLISTFLSLPILLIKDLHPAFAMLFQLGTVFILGFFSIAYFYWLSAKQTTTGNRFWYYVKRFPLFISLCMGLSLHNSIAVIEGWIGKKSPFIRTPKFNVTRSQDSWANNKYVKPSLSLGVLVEGLLALYFLGGLGVSIYLQEYSFSFFMLFPSIGFLLVFIYSLTAHRHAAA